MSKIKIVIDPDLCIGAASCVTVSPDFFQLNSDNKAYTLDRGVSEDDHKYERELEIDDELKDQILLAAQSCPTLAISIYDEEGNKIFPSS